VKNSWGTDFGHSGYVYVRYGNNTCSKTYCVLLIFHIAVCYNLIRILRCCSTIYTGAFNTGAISAKQRGPLQRRALNCLGK